jgi:hypothetical protein
VPRLLIFWTRPDHLSADEADGWARQEAARLLADEAIDSVELTRLNDASFAHPRQWDWMLELHLAARGHENEELVSDACADWLADLRLLGMRPAIVFANSGSVLRREDG